MILFMLKLPTRMGLLKLLGMLSMRIKLIRGLGAYIIGMARLMMELM